MAESEAQFEEINQEKQGQRLKYLDFVQVAAMQAVTCLSCLYDFAKENSGPLKPGVQSVEGTVKAVVSPVYEKLHDVPFELLKFVDRKVDDSVHELEKYVPSLVKQASSQAYTAAQKAPEVARSVAGEVQRSGVVATAVGMAKAAFATCEPVARDVYNRYEPVAEEYAVSAWRLANRLPLFPQVAHVVVPTAAYWSEKYNGAVGCAAARGYELASFLPLVPVERIAKVFGSDAGGESNGNETVTTGNETVTKEVPVTAAE